MTSLTPADGSRDRLFGFDDRLDDIIKGDAYRRVVEALNDPDRLSDMAEQVVLLRRLKAQLVSFVDGKLFYVTEHGASVVLGNTVTEAQEDYRILKAAYIGGHVATFQRDHVARQLDLITWNGNVYRYLPGSIDIQDRSTLLKEINGEPCWKVRETNIKCLLRYSETLVCNGKRGPTFNIIFDVLDTKLGPLYVASKIGRGAGKALVHGVSRIMSARRLTSPILWKDSFLLSRQNKPDGAYELVRLEQDGQQTVLRQSVQFIGYHWVGDELLITLRQPEGINDEIIWKGESLYLKDYDHLFFPSRPDLFIISGTDTDSVHGVWVNCVRVVVGRHCRSSGGARINEGSDMLELRLRHSDTRPPEPRVLCLEAFGLGLRDR
jgi:hypothetical protein